MFGRHLVDWECLRMVLVTELIAASKISGMVSRREFCLESGYVMEFYKVANFCKIIEKLIIVRICDLKYRGAKRNRRRVGSGCS